MSPNESFMSRYLPDQSFPVPQDLVNDITELSLEAAFFIGEMVTKDSRIEDTASGYICTLFAKHWAFYTEDFPSATAWKAQQLFQAEELIGAGASIEELELAGKAIGKLFVVH